MTDNVLSPLATSESTSLADWFELATLASGRRMLSPAKAADLQEVLGGAADTADIALAFGELHRRAQRASPGYPFSFGRFGLERTSTDPSAYELLLVTSGVGSDFVELSQPDLAVLALERFVRSAIASMIGPRGRVIRFGYPPEGSRPPTFSAAVRWLGVEMGARVLPLMGSDLRRADGGIDVIGWRLHWDEFGPGPVLAVQVTFERDLRSKSLEIAGNDFNRWFRLPSPVAVLASPCDGYSDPDLMVELSGRVLFMDRWRLLEAFDAAPILEPASVEWISSVLRDLEI